MPNPQDTVQVLMPNVLRDRLAELRLHPRQPMYEIIEAALDYWEEMGGWAPVMPAPVDPYPPRTWVDAMQREMRERSRGTWVDSAVPASGQSSLSREARRGPLGRGLDTARR